MRRGAASGEPSEAWIGASCSRGRESRGGRARTWQTGLRGGRRATLLGHITQPRGATARAPPIAGLYPSPGINPVPSGVAGPSRTVIRSVPLNQYQRRLVAIEYSTMIVMKSTA